MAVYYLERLETSLVKTCISGALLIQTHLHQYFISISAVICFTMQVPCLP